jgi:hypothetical protein
MKDATEKFERLLTDAEDCTLISKLAADPTKRERFAKLSARFRKMAKKLEVATEAEADPEAPLARASTERNLTLPAVPSAAHQGEQMTTLRCMNCGVERRLTAVEPIVEGYEITSYECANCKTVVRLVEGREKPTSLE